MKKQNYLSKWDISISLLAVMVKIAVIILALALDNSLNYIIFLAPWRAYLEIWFGQALALLRDSQLPCGNFFKSSQVTHLFVFVISNFTFFLLNLFFDPHLSYSSEQLYFWSLTFFILYLDSILIFYFLCIYFMYLCKFQQASMQIQGNYVNDDFTFRNCTGRSHDKKVRRALLSTLSHTLSTSDNPFLHYFHSIKILPFHPYSQELPV